MREIYESRRYSGRTPCVVPERSDEEIAARWERILELAGSMEDVIPEDFVEEHYRIRDESTRELPNSP